MCLISVVVPVYNAGVLIDRCLDSVFGQVGDFPVEVILVDDGSTDNSVELIRRRPEQDRIRLFQQKNSGPSKARNVGIEAATGQYLAFLDADDYWLPGFLSATVGFLNAHEECVAVSVAQRHISLEGEGFSPKSYNEISDGKPIVIKDFFKFWGEHSHICTGSILIRSSIAKRTGGFRTDLKSCEDIEYWANIACLGKMGFIPEVYFVSDGTKVTTALGWSKYRSRFRATVDYEVWVSRLKERLSDDDFKDGSGIFDSVILGITRSFICGKKFKSAYKNLRHYNGVGKRHYMKAISDKGIVLWYLFCSMYFSYRFLKINLPYYKHLLGL